MAFAAMVLAAVLVLVALILLVARFTSPKRPSTERISMAARENTNEKVFVGKSGDLGFVLRSAGPGPVGRWKRDSEGRSIALEPGQIIARMDAYNFSSDSVALVDGPLVVRMGDRELKPLPKKGETDPASPLYAALAGGDPAPVMPPRSSRRIGLVGIAADFDDIQSAAVQRGRIAEDVTLWARTISERELAEFDRAPAPAGLEKMIAEGKPKYPLR